MSSESTDGSSRGEQNDRSLKIPCHVDQLSPVRDAMKEFLSDSFDRIDTNRIILSVDEALANIVEHAYDDLDATGGAVPEIELYMQRLDDRVRFCLEDRGPVFNPTELPPPDLEEHGRNSKDGGLGVFLYTTLMDSAVHEAREGGGNRLTLEKRLPPA